MFTVYQYKIISFKIILDKRSDKIILDKHAPYIIFSEKEQKLNWNPGLPKMS